MFFIDELDGIADSRIVAAFTAIMLVYSTRNIGSSAGVERIVSALNYVNIPHTSPFGGSARSPETGGGSLAHHHGEQAKKPLW